MAGKISRTISWDTFCESAKSRMNLPKIAITVPRLTVATVDHWEVHPADGRAYLYLYLFSLCERTQSRCEIRGHAPSSREPRTPREVDFQRLSRSKIRLRPSRGRIHVEGRAYARSCFLSLSLLRGSFARNNPSTSTLAKSMCHRVQSDGCFFFLRVCFEKVDEIFSIKAFWILQIIAD